MIKSAADSNKRGNRNEQKAFLHRISKRKKQNYRMTEHKVRQHKSPNFGSQKHLKASLIAQVRFLMIIKCMLGNNTVSKCKSLAINYTTSKNL